MIKPRTKEEKEMLGRMKRRNNIAGELNKNFEPKSIDEEDEQTILDWACLTIPTERLCYLFDKIKHERFNRSAR